MKNNDDHLMEMARELSSLATTQQHTSENVDKLTRSVETLVSSMGKLMIGNKEFNTMKSDITVLKAEVYDLRSFDKISEFRNNRIEKVVYGAVGVILLAVITAVVSTVVSHAQ